MGYRPARSSGFGLLPAGEECFAPAAGELGGRNVPQRVGKRVPERAVVGEDLQLVEAAPAGTVERREDARDVGDAVAREEAVGEAPGRLAHVVDVDARDAADLACELL